jgi:hypothetical protein
MSFTEIDELSGNVLMEIRRELLQATVKNHVSLHFNLCLMSAADVLF